MKNPISIEKLSNLAKIQVGYQIRAGIQTDRNGSYYLVQVRDFGKDSLLIQNSQLRFTPSDTEKPDKYVIKKNDVLFVAKGQYNRSYLTHSIKQNSVAGNSFYILTPTPKILSEYLNWYLNCELALDYFRKNTSGSTIPFVSVSTLANLEIPVPDFSIQSKIAEIQNLYATETNLIEQISKLKRKFIEASCIKAAQGK